jgi:hypothetical protein
MSEHSNVVIFEGKEFTTEWPPQNAVMFLLWLQRQLAGVAPSCRNDVRIEIGHNPQCGSYITLSHPSPPAVVTHAAPQPRWSRLAQSAAVQHA